MNRITVSVEGKVKINDAYCNSIPYVPTSVNKKQRLVVLNSGRIAKSFSEAVAMAHYKAWHLIVGREEDQIIQLGSFNQTMPCGRTSWQSSTINVMLINYGKLTASKNLHINCWKRHETDVYIGQGQAWHMYTKYQVHVIQSLQATLGLPLISVTAKSESGNPVGYQILGK